MHSKLRLLDTLRSVELPQSERRVLKRHEYLLTPGLIENNMYYVEEGALRLYYVSKNAEHDIRFGYTGSIITSLRSFITGAPSEYFIQAIRKTVIVQVPKKSFYTYIDSDPVLQKEYCLLLEGLAVQQLERELDILTESPSERFQRVLERSPQLFQEIPLKYIASYLRMTPETLSRLRRKPSASKS